MSKQMNLIEQLISEVEITPLLWDRYHNDYNNRAAMDREWERIAKLLNKDKDFVKQKWRNLRDQFHREIKKVKVPFDNPTKPYIQYYRGKWLYFENMMFLKDVPLKRSSTTGYSPLQEIEIHDDDIIKEELIVFEDSDDMFGEQANIYNNESDNNDSERPVTDPDVVNSQNVNYELLIQPKVEILDEVQPEAVVCKRPAIEVETAIPAKIKKLAATDASSNTEDNGEIDDDLYFLKSLVPYLRKLSPIRKLLVRNEIQSLLIRESLCDNCKFGQSSSHHS